MAGVAPRSLISLHLLRMYFADFALLLDRASARDPLHEFLVYRTARNALRNGTDRDTQAWSGVEAAFANYSLKVPNTSPDDLLRTLELQVPDVFPRWVADEEFNALLNALAEDPD